MKNDNEIQPCKKTILVLHIFIVIICTKLALIFLCLFKSKLNNNGNINH
jgi:hypothetical protein